MITEKATGRELEIVEHVQGSIWCVAREAGKTAKRVYRLDELAGDVQEACAALTCATPWDNQQVEKQVNSLQTVDVMNTDRLAAPAWQARAKAHIREKAIKPLPEVTHLAHSKFASRTVAQIARELACDEVMIARLLAVTMNRFVATNMVIPGHFVEMMHKVLPVVREAWIKEWQRPHQGI